MTKDLNRSELEALHSVMRRAAERAERRQQEKPDPDAVALADAVAQLAEDIVRRG